MNYKGYVKLSVLVLLMSVNLVVVNLLIAAISYTYRHLSSSSQLIYLKVLLSDLLTLQLALPAWLVGKETGQESGQSFYNVVPVEYTDLQGKLCARERYLFYVERQTS